MLTNPYPIWLGVDYVMLSVILLSAVIVNCLPSVTPASLRRRPQIPLAIYQQSAEAKAASEPIQTEFQKEKPICGPVPFADLSCEMPTSCSTKFYPPYLQILHKSQIPEVLCNTMTLPTRVGSGVQRAGRESRFEQNNVHPTRTPSASAAVQDAKHFI
ncbi:hypothetical protein B5X24_HaOG204459 [Helicoverpa armigera]|uniref:Uncharacterized protein n=1 Tax=Helicoverpa armigera TaxID=29058 RepID=A0A2W1BUV3_HELAM|nr:hypothetical protein B5X24_HaOG204459 [Helicoverpa armigera]